MAIRIRRMTVFAAGILVAGQTDLRTKMVRCHGAQKVAWILRATSSDQLAACAPYGTMDRTADAPEANFVEIVPGALGAQAGNPQPLGDMSLGGTLCEIGPDIGTALCLEQAELHFDSHASNNITGFSVVCEIHDEIGSDEFTSATSN